MIKKILYIIFFFIIAFTPVSIAQDDYKITSVNFDTSNSLLFLTAPDTTGLPTADEISSLKNIKLNKLENPKRVYFDLESAVITVPQQNWHLNSESIKQVRVSQFSTNPNVVRIVLFTSEDYNLSLISFYKVNNNLVIKFKNDDICKEDYFQTLYKDDRVSSSDFYENLSITNEDLKDINSAIQSASQNDVIYQIQKSFNPQAAAEKEKAKEQVTKNLRLKSKYYLDKITIKDNGILLSGFGSLTLERPMILAAPSRIVYDIQNSIINPSLANKEFKYGQETIRVSQYNQNKIRLVITTNEIDKYAPIFSSDSQSILFTKDNSTNLRSLFTRTNDVISYNISKNNSSIHELVLGFNAPLVFSIKRSAAGMTIYLYNTLRYSQDKLAETVRNSAFEGMKSELLPKVGIKLTIPVDRTYTAYCAEGADGKALRLTIKGNNLVPQKPIQTQPKKLLPASPFKKYGTKDVVLDAGHGGTDYGAIREGVNEKDINLDMVMRVEAILKSKGIKVCTTRDTDEYLTLQQRVDISESIMPQIFVSVHVNSSTKPEIYGIETHYYNENSLELANTLHASMIGAVDSKDRGVFKSKFYVISHATVPAVLLEIGFISNAKERSELLSEKRKQSMAKAIANGIIKYLNAN